MSLATSVSAKPAGARSMSAESFDPILLSVLSSRIESIIREMTNTVMKASRSSVIKNARDMSCGILTYDNRLVCVEEALPIHVTALELTTKPIVELFADIKEHDGNTWHNDVFELFFKPAEGKNGYYEFQVNAANTVITGPLPIEVHLAGTVSVGGNAQVGRMPQISADLELMVPNDLGPVVGELITLLLLNQFAVAAGNVEGFAKARACKTAAAGLNSIKKQAGQPVRSWVGGVEAGET